MIQVELEEPEWLAEKRKKALEQYNALEWPNLRYGTTIRADYSGLKTGELSFDNSFFETPEHDEVIILPLAEAVKKHPELVKPYLFDYFDIKHKFHALHAAYWKNGLFVYIPEHAEIEMPIVVDRTVMSNSIHHVLVIAGEGSSASIIVKHSSKNEKQLFSSSAVEAIVRRGAKLTFTSVQNYSKEVFNFDYKKAHVEQDGKIEWFDFCFGSRFTHSDAESVLNSSGAESRTKGLFFGDGEQQFDIGAQSIHAGPHTFSDIASRGVLSGKAKAIYRGLVKIENEAPSSDGYQKEDVLMLSADAEANSIPQLEIDNNEVKCSHAATTSHVDDNQLFYLMSRGLGREEATKLIVQGFLEPFIAQLPGELADEIRIHVEERLC